MLIRSLCLADEPSLYLPPDEQPLYRRMARVLASSAHRNGHRIRIDYGPEMHKSKAFVAKATAWARAIADADEPLALLDCDMVVRAPLDPVWSHDFDLAVTTHGHYLNSGAVFVRPTARVKRWFADWPELTRKWVAMNVVEKPRYSDQDALAEMLSSPRGLEILELPMAIWNSTQMTWECGLEHARIVHVKSGARAILTGENKRPTAVESRVANLWRAEEQIACTS